jgi:excisionase family DNA binding protein
MGVMNTAEAAKRLGLSIRRVQTMIQRGQIVAKKLGRDWVIEEKDLRAFAACPRVPGRPRKTPGKP